MIRFALIGGRAVRAPKNIMNPENIKNDRREIFGWITYDWANSVFFTTVVGVLIGQYITTLAQQAVGENGVVFSLGGYDLVTAKSLFPYSVGLSVFLQIFFLPVMGAIADYTHLKKTFMAFFCYLGAFACCLLFFVAGKFVCSRLGIFYRGEFERGRVHRFLQFFLARYYN